MRQPAMTFLQPFILWGLPLLLVPVIIHLINRLRHRPQPWAAMRFLVSATRSSISQAKLRQFLILLFRCLAVLALILFLSRPLAGGWLGWMLAPAPDVILILLDRSASMETQMSGSTNTAREQALKLLAQSAKEFETASHLVLIESALHTPHEIANAAGLTQLSLTSATDTEADMPALFQSAFNWLVENRAGTAEIWIASDLQRSNWKPDDPRWRNLISQFRSLRQTVRVRLLSLKTESEPNASVNMSEITRRDRAGQTAELHLVSELQRNRPSSAPVPVTVGLDGSRSQVELVIESQILRWRHKAELGAKTSGGWGSLGLPADANRHDNAAYFVYGPETALRATVVSSDAKAGRRLQLAASASGAKSRELAPLITPGEFASARVDDNCLIVWQDELPVDAVAERLRTFVEAGGVAVFFPPGRPDARRFQGIGWAELQETSETKPFRIVRWDEDQGPLARTDEGLSLPVRELGFQRRQIIAGAKNVLAAYSDGTAFLVRQSLGRGEVFFCASSPSRGWSTLGEGPVLVPMMQRCLQAGSRRLQRNATVWCGQVSAADQAVRWTPVDSTAVKDIRTQAGVYRSGDRLLAVNRPVNEDDLERLPPERVRTLFAGLPFQSFQEDRRRSDALQGEFWRVFLLAMLLFLLVEGILILPPRTAGVRPRLPNAPASTSTYVS